MKNFHLFWDKTKNAPIVIKTGFNFWAFLFPFLYPVFKNYWRVALMYFSGALMISIIALFITDQDDNLSFLINLVFHLFVGFDYADYALLEQKKSKKTDYLGVVLAENYDHAEFLAFQKHRNSLNKAS